MSVEAILTPIINQEFQKYQNMGYQIRLKTAKERRVKYQWVCGSIALVSLALVPFIFVIMIPIYIILMSKTKNNVGIILSLARKVPDKPIEQIVAEEIINV